MSHWKYLCLNDPIQSLSKYTKYNVQGLDKYNKIDLFHKTNLLE